MANAQSPKNTAALKSPAAPRKSAASIGSSRPSGRIEGQVPSDFAQVAQTDKKTDRASVKPTKSFARKPSAMPMYLSGSGSGMPIPTFYSGGPAQGVAHPPTYPIYAMAPVGSGFAQYSGQPEHTFYSGGMAPGAARPPPGFVFSGPSQVWHAPPHAAAAHLSRGNDIVARVPKPLFDSLSLNPSAYQSLSKWTHRALAQGWATMQGWTGGESYIEEDSMIAAQDWTEGAENLLSAISVVDPVTANVFSVHVQSIKARLTPAWWPALRTYDLRIRLAHTGNAGELMVFDNELFAGILLEDHDAMYPIEEESSGEDSGPVLISSPGKSEELASFLESIKEGLGQYAPWLVDAGVANKDELAEVIKLHAFDDVVDQLGAITIKDRAVLKKLIKDCPLYKSADQDAEKV